ncbi:unnamed protein product [Echinostoma caproni]|uniref:Peptidase A2 domain-containing protein n=1 Tax=Echinostoma caproni TaxID=27848 RepID=A0A183BG36_9TREM|nr:unnamed protein product [Echinostoma caproni]
MYKPAVNLREALEKARRREQMSRTNQQEESATCAAVQRNPAEPNTSHPIESTSSRSWCPYCARFGRRAQHCGHNPPTYPRDQKESNATPFSSKGRLEGTPVSFLIDTGASCSSVGEYLVKPTRTADARQSIVTAVNGSKVLIKGRSQLKVSLSRFEVTHLFLVCHGLRWEPSWGWTFCGNIVTRLQS